MLRVCLTEAVRQGLLAVNPAVRVKLLKSSKESKRRAFTLSEIKRILRACDDDREWRGLVLFGLWGIVHVAVFSSSRGARLT